MTSQYNMTARIQHLETQADTRFSQHQMGLISQFTSEANQALESQPNCSFWQHKQQVTLQKAIMPLLRCNKAGIQHSKKTSSTEVITKNFEMLIVQSFKMFCEQQGVKHNCILSCRRCGKILLEILNGICDGSSRTKMLSHRR